MTLEQRHGERLFRIQRTQLYEQGKREPLDQFYLYIYKGNLCEYDYLQDTITACKEVAFEDFEAPLDAWEEVK